MFVYLVHVAKVAQLSLYIRKTLQNSDIHAFELCYIAISLDYNLHSDHDALRIGMKLYLDIL